MHNFVENIPWQFHLEHASSERQQTIASLYANINL